MLVNYAARIIIYGRETDMVQATGFNVMTFLSSMMKRQK
jgi:hypothetical protein